MSPRDRAKRTERPGITRRIYSWVDDRLGISTAILPVIQHPVPKQINWWYVFGSATLVAFIVQVITGVALAFSYVPAPNSAYDSLQFISHEASLGSVVRGIHYWGASAMVILIAIHMARVFMMGSYKYPREINWVTGVLLLLLTLGMAFTGQLLRWDQDAYWAVVVAAEMAGRTPVIGNWLVQFVVAGQTVGGATSLCSCWQSLLAQRNWAFQLIQQTSTPTLVRTGISSHTSPYWRSFLRASSRW